MPRTDFKLLDCFNSIFGLHQSVSRPERVEMAHGMRIGHSETCLES